MLVPKLLFPKAAGFFVVVVVKKSPVDFWGKKHLWDKFHILTLFFFFLNQLDQTPLWERIGIDPQRTKGSRALRERERETDRNGASDLPRDVVEAEEETLQAG